MLSLSSCDSKLINLMLSMWYLLPDMCHLIPIAWYLSLDMCYLIFVFHTYFAKFAFCSKIAPSCSFCTSCNSYILNNNKHVRGLIGSKTSVSPSQLEFLMPWTFEIRLVSAVKTWVPVLVLNSIELSDWLLGGLAPTQSSINLFRANCCTFNWSL